MNFDLKVIYRISDKGNPKEKLLNADKFSCIKNAEENFGLENIHIIADNCHFDTIDFLNNIGAKYEQTELGNIGSFLYVLDKVVKEYNPDSYVYFLEDDYLHRGGAKTILLEGLQIADYVTLYDHPDKYINIKNNGNPFNYFNLQKSTLFVTKNSHWRTINSTTMTFAAKVKTIKEDLSILKNQPRNGVPNDFGTFVTLTKQNNIIDFIMLVMYRKKIAWNVMKNIFSFRKRRVLLSSIPGLATHAELKYLAPTFNWEDI